MDSKKSFSGLWIVRLFGLMSAFCCIESTQANDKIGVTCSLQGLGPRPSKIISLDKSYAAKYSARHNTFQVSGADFQELLKACQNLLKSQGVEDLSRLILQSPIGLYGRALSIEVGSPIIPEDSCSPEIPERSLAVLNRTVMDIQKYVADSELENRLNLVKYHQFQKETKINEMIFHIHASEQAGTRCELLAEDQFKEYQLEGELQRSAIKTELEEVQAILFEKERLKKSGALTEATAKDLSVKAEESLLRVNELNDAYRKILESNIEKSEHVVFEFLQDVEEDAVSKLEDMKKLLPAALKNKKNEEWKIAYQKAKNYFGGRKDVSLSSSKNLQDANDEWLDVCESIKTQKERIMGIESAYKVSIRILNWNIQEHTELVTYVENIRNQIKEAVAEIKE